MKSGIAADAIRFADALKSKLLVAWSENCFAACLAGRAGMRTLATGYGLPNFSRLRKHQQAEAK